MTTHSRADQRKTKLIIGLLNGLSYLPLGVMQSIGAGVGRLMWWIPNASKRHTLINLSLCYPHLSVSEREQLAKRSLIETARFGFEMGAIWSWSKEKCLSLIKQVNNESLFKNAVAQKKGVLVILPHLGNWEVLGPYMGLHASVTALYKPPKIAALEQVIKNARERNELATVPTNRRGVMALLKALKAGEVVVILPDQEPNERHSGVFAPFMGVNALTMTLIHGLLQKTDAIPLFMFATRDTQRASFTLHVASANKAIRNEDKVASATALNEGIAECVAEAPEQYQWEYKRFKQQPDNTRHYS
ncbi:MAG: lysophospholipid acyltransferase family protein [Pseudomonadota bacterium]